MKRRVEFKYVFWVLLLFCKAEMGLAQKGSAPNGYYPPNYSGSTFSGEVTKTNSDSQEMTLLYKKGDKSEEFTAHLEAPCSMNVKGKTIPITVGDTPPGTLLTVFYNEHTTKVNGVKTKDYVIIAISPSRVEGKVIPEDQRRIYFCTSNGQVHFQAH